MIGKQEIDKYNLENNGEKDISCEGKTDFFSDCIVLKKGKCRNDSEDFVSSSQLLPESDGRATFKICWQNIAKCTMDPGVDYFNQYLWFGLVGLVW